MQPTRKSVLRLLLSSWCGCLFFLLVLAVSLFISRPLTEASTLSAVRYVSASGDCGGATPCYTTIQAALDAAAPGDTIKVSQGTYTTSTTIIATITKAITLSGGYATNDWDHSQPLLYPTILDAGMVSGRRGIHINSSGVSTVTVENLTVQNGFVEFTSGGGIQIVTGTVILRNLTVSNSRARDDQGGGVQVVNGNVTVENCTIEDNFAGRGGGLNVENGRLSIRNSSIRRNSAYFGGGVAATFLANLNLEANLFEDNSGAYGGGAFAESGYGHVTEKRAVGNTFRGNTVSYGGGGAEFRGGGIFADNVFERNTGSTAGGLSMDGTVTLYKNRFYENNGVIGGAVSFGGGELVLNGNIIQHNRASVSGGAIYLAGGTIAASNDVVANNISPNAGVYMKSGQMVARHWTLVGNSLYGVYAEDGSAEVVNTIVVSHTVAGFSGLAGTLSADHILFSDNGTTCSGPATCTNSLSDSPQFVNAGAGDFHLRPESVAIDAGKDAGITTDMDDDPRPLCHGYDIGADEVNLVACPTVRLAPDLKRAYLVAGAFTVDLTVENVANLAGFQTDLLFDPAIVSVNSISLGTFLESTGRTVVPVGPVIDNATGVVTFGAFSFGSQVAASGTGVLATISFQPRAIGSTALHLQATGLADPAGNALHVKTTDGQVQIVKCFGDFNDDGKVDILDLQRAVGHWNCRTGQACYDAQFDTEPDGDIDVFDLQRFAAAWGTVCTASAQGNGLPALAASVRPDHLTAADLSVLPASRRVAPGAVFTHTVQIQNAADVGAFEATVTYSPTVAQVEAVTIGPFLSATGRTAMTVGPAIDNVAGAVTFGAFTFGGQNGAFGSGDLAYVRFRAQQEGRTAVSLQEALVSDLHGNALPANVLAGAEINVGVLKVYLPLVMR